MATFVCFLIIALRKGGGHGEKNYERFMDTAAATLPSISSSHESSSPLNDIDRQSQSSRSSFDSPQTVYDDIPIQQQHSLVPAIRHGSDNISSPVNDMPTSSGSNTLDSAIALVTLRHGVLSPVSFLNLFSSEINLKVDYRKSSNKSPPSF